MSVSVHVPQGGYNATFSKTPGLHTVLFGVWLLWSTALRCMELGQWLRSAHLTCDIMTLFIFPTFFFMKK